MSDIPQPFENPSTAMELRSGKKISKIETAAPTFHLFPKLPTELRLMVWKFAVKPRVMKLYLSAEDRAGRTAEEHGDWYRMKNMKVNTPVPPLLHTCYESRQISLSIYTMTKFYWTDQKPVYYDLDNDILLIPGDNRGSRRFRRAMLRELNHQFPHQAITMKVRNLACGQLALRNMFWPLKNVPNLIDEVERDRIHAKLRQSTNLKMIHLVGPTKPYANANPAELEILEREYPPSWIRQRPGNKSLETIKKAFANGKKRYPHWNLPDIKYGAIKRVKT